MVNAQEWLNKKFYIGTKEETFKKLTDLSHKEGHKLITDNEKILRIPLRLIPSKYWDKVEVDSDWDREYTEAENDKSCNGWEGSGKVPMTFSHGIDGASQVGISGPSPWRRKFKSQQLLDNYKKYVDANREIKHYFDTHYGVGDKSPSFVIEDIKVDTWFTTHLPTQLTQLLKDANKLFIQDGYGQVTSQAAFEFLQSIVESGEIEANIKFLQGEEIDLGEWEAKWEAVKSNVTKVNNLNIANKDLEGELDLSDFINLKELHCYFNKLTKLNLWGLKNLQHIDAGFNMIEDLDSIINSLDPEKLTFLKIHNNNFSKQDLSKFSKFTKLESLLVSNIYGVSGEKNIDEGKYNRFYGSLEPLKNMTKLWELDISNTDLSTGVEHLPVLIRRLECSTERPDCQLKEIEEELDQFKNNPNLFKTKKLEKQINDSWTAKFATLQNEYQQLKEQITSSQKTLVSQIPNKPTLIKKIGEGGFAKVYKASLNNDIIAVKQSKVSLDNISEKELRDFEAEIHLLERLRNKHIIQYYGIYQDDSDFFIMMEYAKYGTLTDFIQGTKHKSTDWEINYNLIQHMARGLSYLHNNNIIHRDLKSMNVLVTDGYLAKISDFGLSQVVDNLNMSKVASKGLSGTVRWMAPELLTKNRQHTAYSDIYALGMIMWEIASKKTVPFDYAQSEVDVLMCHLRKEKEEIPNDTPTVLKEIITGCWKDTPQERISLTQIINKIEEASKIEATNQHEAKEQQLEAIIAVPPKN